MHDLDYILTGYGATAAVILGFRWRLAVRSRRARQYVAKLDGHARSGRA
jgi:hypothetical protein